MTDVSTILGIALIGVGAASAVYGAILCYTTKGEYFNDEEVRIMLAREAEEDRKRRDEELAREEAEEIEAKNEEGKRKKRGIIIAN